MQLSDDPIRLAPPATQAEIDGRARAVAAIIRSVAMGPMTDISVCVKAARERVKRIMMSAVEILGEEPEDAGPSGNRTD